MVDHNHLKEKKLVQSLINGDFEAFDHLFNYYNQRLYFFAKSILKNKEDAHDIVQEVFLRVWRNRDTLDPHSSFKSFLFTVSYNIIVDTLRKRISEQSFRDELIKNAIIDESSADKDLSYNELNSIYQEAINELPDKRKEIYRLHRFDNLSYQEIADKLNISINTVRNQMAHAISYLRGRIGKETLVGLVFVCLFV